MSNDFLYWFGFYVEYRLLCLARGLAAFTRWFVRVLGALLTAVLRPVALGCIQLRQALRRPKAWLGLVVPLAGVLAFAWLVRTWLGQPFALRVEVNGTVVGYVASEQDFDTARADVQARVNTARALLEAAGADVPDWDLDPAFTLAVSADTMTPGEVANAILQASGSEITAGTAVYVDGALRFVTTEGDHLRSYLENIKAPFENAMDSSVYTAFAHNIRLVDGVYLQESVSSYADVINALTEGGGIHTYTAVDGDTVESVVNATGVTFDSLAQMNPELLTLDQEIPAGTVITTGASSAELIKVKVVRRDTETVAIPFDTQNTESDQYDFGKVVTLQEGTDGSEEITYETTMIDGAVTDRQAVAYNVLQAPTPEITVTGTKLKNGMIAKVGSGSFIWPVPNYKYVSRWMGNGHRGADICAAYGTPILASDSGTIIAAGWHYSYGNYVEIDHGNGYKTLYGHMSSIAVSQGQAVTQGQVIGYVGSTGNSTGNHCHFEMSYNGALFSAYTLFSGM